MQNRLFRQTSLDRLASLEQLDVQLQVTSPRAWLALLAVFIIVASAAVWGVFGTIATTVSAEGILLRTVGDTQPLQAPVAGTLTDVLVEPGDIVASGQVVARIIPQAGEPVTIESDTGGQVEAIFFQPGTRVQAGEVLLSLALDDAQPPQLMGVIYVSAAESRDISRGMTVRIAPVTVRTEEVGVMLGEVIAVNRALETSSTMLDLLGRDDLVRYFSDSISGLPASVRVALRSDFETASGYAWTMGGGADIQLQSGTLFEATIIIDERPPLSLVFPEFQRLLGWWVMR